MSTEAQPHKRLLIIDDSIATREAMSLILGGEGYQVAAAANGADAIAWLKRFGRPNLILLDLGMPVMDGLAFCRKQKEDEALSSIPVVLLSAAGDVAEKATAVGAASYVQKPVDPGRLLDALRRCCP